MLREKHMFEVHRSSLGHNRTEVKCDHQAQGESVPVWLQKVLFSGTKRQFDTKKYAPICRFICTLEALMQDFQNHQAQGGWVPIWLQKNAFWWSKATIQHKEISSDLHGLSVD
jgi:hypothetical protein